MACETHAGDEGIPMGLTCIELHPSTAAMFAKIKLSILKPVQACLYKLQNRKSLQAALL